ncbi:MAG: polymer-forming cytoskeletal protein [Mangrovibacterium sp.]
MAKTNKTIDHPAINLIGKGTCITGDVIAKGDIRIDGELNGTLQCSGRVVIGQPGRVNGELNAKNCEVAGSVDGKFRIEEMLTIRASARVKGEIKTRQFSIEPGATFSGSCCMDEHEKTGPL